VSVVQRIDEEGLCDEQIVTDISPKQKSPRGPNKQTKKSALDTLNIIRAYLGYSHVLLLFFFSCLSWCRKVVCV